MKRAPFRCTLRIAISDLQTLRSLRRSDLGNFPVRLELKNEVFRGKWWCGLSLSYLYTTTEPKPRQIFFLSFFYLFKFK